MNVKRTRREELRRRMLGCGEEYEYEYGLCILVIVNPVLCTEPLLLMSEPQSSRTLQRDVTLSVIQEALNNDGCSYLQQASSKLV